MKPAFSAALSAYAAPVVVACSLIALAWPMPRAVDPDVVASVDGVLIRKEDFLPRFGWRDGEFPPGTDEATKQRSALEAVITRQVLFNEVERQRLPHPPEVRRAMINSLLRKNVFSTNSCASPDDRQIEEFVAQAPEDLKPQTVTIRQLSFLFSDDISRERAAVRVREAHEEASNHPERFEQLVARLATDPDVLFHERIIPDLSSVVTPWDRPRVAPGGISRIVLLDRSFAPLDSAYGFVKVISRTESPPGWIARLGNLFVRQLRRERSRDLLHQYTEELMRTRRIARFNSALYQHEPLSDLPSPTPDIGLYEKP